MLLINKEHSIKINVLLKLQNHSSKSSLMEATTVVCDCKQLHRRHNTEQYSFKIYLSMTVVYCTVV